MSGSFFALTDRVTTAGRLAIFTVATSRPERENDFEFPDEYSERKPVQLHAHSAHETITFFFLRLSLPLILPSIYLSHSPILSRAWHTHLDDQLDLGHVAVTGAVLMAVVRHPAGIFVRDEGKTALLSCGVSRRLSRLQAAAATPSLP